MKKPGGRNHEKDPSPFLRGHEKQRETASERAPKNGNRDAHGCDVTKKGGGKGKSPSFLG